MFRRPEMIRQRMERFEGFDFGRGFGGREAAVVTAFSRKAIYNLSFLKC